MQVSLQTVYERLWGEMRQMHERCLLAEEANEQLEKENAELKAKLEEMEGADRAVVEEEDAFLEKLKAEVKD